MDYKADITLNEKDSLTDILQSEKNLAKLYAFAVTEGCSKGFRTAVKTFFNETAAAQFEVFLMLTELGSYRTESATEESLLRVKKEFSSALKELS